METIGRILPLTPSTLRRKDNLRMMSISGFRTHSRRDRQAKNTIRISIRSLLHGLVQGAAVTATGGRKEQVACTPVPPRPPGFLFHTSLAPTMGSRRRRRRELPLSGLVCGALTVLGSVSSAPLSPKLVRGRRRRRRAGAVRP
uniref:Uncharacterized protein n=1 Tax=Setaria viridis TaxID=4556 RepID=A0A4U6UZ46_SETVI|nr:hypothetical protein SEVIR_4G202000v2 [Setaria viridis]